MLQHSDLLSALLNFDKQRKCSYFANMHDLCTCACVCGCVWCGRGCGCVVCVLQCTEAWRKAHAACCTLHTFQRLRQIEFTRLHSAAAWPLASGHGNNAQHRAVNGMKYLIYGISHSQKVAARHRPLDSTYIRFPCMLFK